VDYYWWMIMMMKSKYGERDWFYLLRNPFLFKLFHNI
jgi:hypothetical protein